MKSNYRGNLEREKAKLMSALESRETAMRGMVVRHLRKIVDEINLLDSGEHWTQQEGDTKSRIYISQSNEHVKKTAS